MKKTLFLSGFLFVLIFALNSSDAAPSDNPLAEKLIGRWKQEMIDTQNPTSTRKIDKIQFNVPVDESRFGKPD